MNRNLRSSSASLVIASLLLTSSPSMAQSVGNPPAVSAAPDAATAPVVETEKERKKRLAAEEKQRKAAEKAAKKEAKRIAREEEKQRKAAERAARPKKSNGLANCVGGAALGILGAVLLGGKKKSAGEIIAGAAIGCAVGYGLGEILSKRDQEEMADYVDNDFLLRDDVQQSTFNAPESKQTVALSKSAATSQQAEHQVRLAPDVQITQNNFLVNDRYMRATTSLRMRSSPDTTGNDNINGGFDPNDVVRTFGSTVDGKWTYIVERGTDGVYTVMGYAATQYLSTDLNRPTNVRVTAAKPKPVPQARRGSSKNKGSTGASATTQSGGVQTAGVQTIRAPTTCKSFTAAAGGKQGGGSGCSGARSLALLNPTLAKRIRT